LIINNTSTIVDTTNNYITSFNYKIYNPTDMSYLPINYIFTNLSTTITSVGYSYVTDECYKHLIDYFDNNGINYVVGKTFWSINDGGFHTIGIDYTGQVWSWGGNQDGQLGDNSTVSKSTPMSILGTKKTFCSINAGDLHTTCIDYQGQVWGWGSNNYAQMGVYNSTTPLRVCYF